MIDRMCKTLEKQARDNNHHVTDGFQAAHILKVPMLRIDCELCDFFAVMDPETGKFIQSYSGPCRGNNSQEG